jgi:dihydrofolate reductase
MRKIIAYDRVSADGYFSTPDGKLDWTVPDPEIERGAAASSAQGPGTLLFGRRTYDIFEAFWPHAIDDSDSSPDPHRAGRRNPELRAMATYINEAEKIVFSKSKEAVTWKNARLLREIEPGAIEALKAQPGRDIMLFGSGTVASKLTELGLIDEYTFIVGPLLLGAGKPLVAGVPNHTKLELLEAKPSAAGNVLLRYARAS